MIVVVDASAGFELLTDSLTGQHIRKTLEQAEATIAPDLYVSELANICWKAVQRNELSLDQATLGLRLSLSVIDIWKTSNDIAVEALREANMSGHPAYDLMYLITARREGATLISLDKGMRALAKKMGVRVTKM